MISFRFHVVSITAVFLAIAIGVVVGSTFVDRAIVDGLEERIDNVSANLDDRRAEIAALQDELGRLEDFTDEARSFAVSGRLPDESLLVVAPRGVDEDPAREVAELAAVAGAAAPGVLWIEPRWALADDGALAELAELVTGVDSEDSAGEVRAGAWEAALEELVAPEADPDVDGAGGVEGEVPAGGGEEPVGGEAPAGGEEPAGGEAPPDPTTTPTTAAPPPDDPPEIEVLTELLEAGFLSFEPLTEGATLESLAATSPTVVLVTGNRVDEELEGLARPLVAGLVEAGLATVVAEVFVDPGEPEEGEEVPSRGEAATAAVPEGAATEVSIVDHLDLPVGRVAAVLAAADLRRDVVGRYGFGDGAASVLPAWTAL